MEFPQAGYVHRASCQGLGGERALRLSRLTQMCTQVVDCAPAAHPDLAHSHHEQQHTWTVTVTACLGTIPAALSLSLKYRHVGCARQLFTQRKI